MHNISAPNMDLDLDYLRNNCILLDILSTISVQTFFIYMDNNAFEVWIRMLFEHHHHHHACDMKALISNDSWCYVQSIIRMFCLFIRMLLMSAWLLIIVTTKTVYGELLLLLSVSYEKRTSWSHRFCSNYFNIQCI